MSPKVKKVISIVTNVLFYIFIAVCLLALTLSILSKKETDAANIFGYQMRYVLTASMEASEATDVSAYEVKSIKQKSVVFIQSVPNDPAEAEAWYASLKVGDVLTFRYVYTSQETITHRIIDIRAKESGGYLIALEGDNKGEDAQVMTQTIDTSLTESPNYVIGKVVAVSYPLGLLVSLLRSDVGLICVVIVPAVIIIIFEAMRISNLLAADRKAKAKEEKEQTQNEIEELKRQLAALQNTPPAGGEPPQEQTPPAGGEAPPQDNNEGEQQ